LELLRGAGLMLDIVLGVGRYLMDAAAVLDMEGVGGWLQPQQNLLTSWRLLLGIVARREDRWRSVCYSSAQEEEMEQKQHGAHGRIAAA
jgi:hypothetical protein